MSRLTKAVRRIFNTRPRRPGVRPALDRAAGRRSADQSAAAARQRIEQFAAPFRLHLACGKVHLPGWINIDQDAVSNIVDVSWDLRRKLPLQDECAEFVFHEHFLEHLTVQEGLALLKECRRVLRPGGVLRVAMPDLAEVVRQYYENDWRHPWMKKYGYEWIETRAENINIAFREWQHQWLYDREELHRRLKEAGFDTIHDCQRRHSTTPALANLETRDESLLVCEAVK